jgi:tetratricopeptide (TPR) repeat protein
VLPEEATKADYYRGRCLACHGEADCQLSLDERRATQVDDSCFACHMPRASTQIRHAAATDHRIPRAPGAPRPRRTPTPAPAWSPLVAFEALILPREADSSPLAREPNATAGGTAADPDEMRNLAVALTKAMGRHPQADDERVLERTIGWLEQAVSRDGSDVAAREAYAFALENGGDLPAALRQIGEVLRREPRRESTLASAASMLMSAGQWMAAAEQWDRARKVDPWIVRHWTDLALCDARLGRWDECAATCEEALVRFPESFGARQLLIESRLVAGRAGEAQKEYERMLELNPPKVEAVRRWWENHPLRQPAGRRPPQ